MTRTLTAALAAIALSASAAQARDFQIRFINDDPAHVSQRVAKAADSVCRAALRTSLDPDFGTLDECVAETVATVQVRNVPASKVASK